MAKAAYLCIHSSPEMRPSMGEVIKILPMWFLLFVGTVNEVGARSNDIL